LPSITKIPVRFLSQRLTLALRRDLDRLQGEPLNQSTGIPAKKWCQESSKALESDITGHGDPGSFRHRLEPIDKSGVVSPLALTQLELAFRLQEQLVADLAGSAVVHLQHD
jgi:hypothetical protein